MKVNREWKSKGTDRPGRNRTRAAPRRSDIMPASSSSPSHPSGGDEGKSKGANRTRRDRTSAKDAADIISSSSPLFRSVCCLTVRTIASRSPDRTTNKGEGRAGTLPGSGGMPSPPPRHHFATDRPATRRAAPRSVCHPASLASSTPSGGEGRAEIQPGQANPSSSPRRPSPPCRGGRQNIPC